MRSRKTPGRWKACSATSACVARSSMRIRVRSSRVIGLADDIARSMSKVSARVAVVPGRNAIGIELPNPKREKVLLRELLSSSDYTDTQARLPLCLGKTIGGEPVIVDLARMPHLLIA